MMAHYVSYNRQSSFGAKADQVNLLYFLFCNTLWVYITATVGQPSNLKEKFFPITLLNKKLLCVPEANEPLSRAADNFLRQAIS